MGRGSKGRLSAECIADVLSATAVTSSFGVRCGTTEEGQKEETNSLLLPLPWINAVCAAVTAEPPVLCHWIWLH